MTPSVTSSPSATIWDVVIVGGGLGGAAAAIFLAQAGWRVLLFEAGRTPRHKMCGEFLSPETIPIFQQLGAWDAITALNPAPMTCARFTAPNGATLDSPLPAGAIGLSRYRLDALLLEQAQRVGVEVREGAAVSGVTGDLASGFQVRTATDEVQARVVVGAWGKRSTVDRALARPFFQQRAPFLALKRHMRGVFANTLVELHGFDGGYCGVNSVEGDVVNVCLLTHTRAWERSGKSVPAFWEMIQRENPQLAARLEGAEAVSEDIVISNVSFAARGVVENDILMVGDSAALISPLAGNGQAMALQAAEKASALINDYLAGRQDALTLKSDYRRHWQRAFGERLHLGRLLQPLFLNPAALGMVLRVGRYTPAIVQWLVNGTRQRT